MKKYTFTMEPNETYEMTMDELVENITREFAKEILNEEEFKTFCDKQDAMLENMRKKDEEYAWTHYINHKDHYLL